MELTNNYQDTNGAIFNIGRSITPGNVVLRFKISTGQCPTPNTSCASNGADGFAMSVFQLGTTEELVTVLNDAYTGGGLGYGVAGPYGNTNLQAFHIEFDTWHNVYNGNSQLHTDPTGQTILPLPSMVTQVFITWWQMYLTLKTIFGTRWK